MLTFELSANVDHIGVQSIYLNVVFSGTARPIKLKFHMETPEDAETKVCTNDPGHMTKMAAILINSKTRLKIIYSRTRRPMTLAFVCGIGDVGLSTKFVQMTFQPTSIILECNQYI